MIFPRLDTRICPECGGKHYLHTEDFAFWRIHALMGHFMGLSYSEVELHAIKALKQGFGK